MNGAIDSAVLGAQLLWGGEWGEQSSHCEWTAGAQLVDGLHPVIPGWFLIWVSDEEHSTNYNLRIQKQLSKPNSLQLGPVDGA